ncbi:MAG: hypothetical protein ICV76_03680 [Nitrospiraceae bacterium]|jgi:protein required for attachment to host cells|nr:hypothetical protein [Nitrospiraceae bacterium]
MPVNMDPKKNRRRSESSDKAASDHEDSQKQESRQFGDENEEDRQKALADAEWKNLWDATEVIDMDTW